MEREKIALKLSGTIIEAAEEYIPFPLTTTEAQNIARAVFARLDSLGYVVVPRIPTDAMIGAAEGTNEGGGIADNGAGEPDIYDPETVYRAMIECAGARKEEAKDD